ncbi:Complex I intermediate-associated protein 30 mitochondrial [Trichostrongylus colubriformis]|uniref:Complex I intermediate-associated protein 30 mitochondrial n=1 Tax=Trichostrongylus colubriformis TaxID=6319 RepID=A0AAN8FIJ7_TRICO
MLLSRCHQRIQPLEVFNQSARFLSTTRTHQCKASTSKEGSSVMGTRSDMKVSDVKSTLGQKAKSAIFSGRDVPMNTNFANERNIRDYDPEFPLEEIIKDAPRLMKQEAKLLKEELSSTKITFEKKELLEDLGAVRHNEARIEWKFDTPEALSKWFTGCDSDWNEGFSKVQLVPTDNKTVLFKGKISTEIIKDGRIERAGWASMKLHDRKFLNRKKYHADWRNFSHLLIKCRGDGRSYKVMLHAPGAVDMTWGDSYSYPLHTRGGPYWQYEKIPFSKFFLTVSGRIQDKQNKVVVEEVSSIGIVLMDRIDGEFQLELDYIGVYNDHTHLENFAYETYVLPLWNTHGI